MGLEGHMRLALHDKGSAVHHSDEGLCPRGDSHVPHQEGGVDLLLDEGLERGIDLATPEVVVPHPENASAGEGGAEMRTSTREVCQRA